MNQIGDVNIGNKVSDNEDLPASTIKVSIPSTPSKSTASSSSVDSSTKSSPPSLPSPPRELAKLRYKDLVLNVSQIVDDWLQFSENLSPVAPILKLSHSSSPVKNPS